MKKLFFIVVPVFFCMMSTVSSDQTQPAYLPIGIDSLQLVTDAVMGGISAGKQQQLQRAGKDCVELSGAVSTENNGGFIQLALDISKQLAQQASLYDGIRIEIIGNAESYNLHLRTSDLWFPWQAYRTTFATSGKWQQINLPFSGFIPYKTSEALKLKHIRRIGIVAIGRQFDANICIASLGFYKNT